MVIQRLVVAAAAACLSLAATGADAFTLEASMARLQGAPEGSRYAAEDSAPAAAPTAPTFASWECKPGRSSDGVVCIFHDPANGNLVCSETMECASYADLNEAARVYVALLR